MGYGLELIGGVEEVGAEANEFASCIDGDLLFFEGLDEGFGFVVGEERESSEHRGIGRLEDWEVFFLEGIAQGELVLEAGGPKFGDADFVEEF